MPEQLLAAEQLEMGVLDPRRHQPPPRRAQSAIPRRSRGVSRRSRPEEGSSGGGRGAASDLCALYLVAFAARRDRLRPPRRGVGSRTSAPRTSEAAVNWQLFPPPRGPAADSPLSQRCAAAASTCAWSASAGSTTLQRDARGRELRDDAMRGDQHRRQFLEPTLGGGRLAAHPRSREVRQRRDRFDQRLALEAIILPRGVGPQRHRGEGVDALEQPPLRAAAPRRIPSAARDG